MLLRVHCILEGAAAEHNLELDGETELTTLKILLEDETGIPMDEQVLVSKGLLLDDNDLSLAGNGFRNNDSVVVYKAGARVAGQMRHEMEMAQIMADRYARAHLGQQNPELAEAVDRGDVARFASILKSIETARRIEADELRDLKRRVEQDPGDEEARRQLDEIQRMEAVQENMMSAMEHHPEAFGQVHMLYINCEVNKVPVKAFVDSGAQMTIMSPSCAERCGIMRLVDPRWAGIAQGVGTAKILGRVHMVDVNIGGAFLPCSISVLENQDVDMLLGLDMLKRHQCCIDLRDNVLRVGTTGTATPFLAEADLPERARLHKRPDSEQAEETVNNLCAMGFSREEVVAALGACQGNADLAAGVLMGS